MCKISVIVPAYNAITYIDKCMESLIAQTYKDFEVVVINDGSTDDTFNRLKKYEDEYSFIKVYHQENKGQAVARNEGVKLSIGEFICFVDSDDYVSIDYLEKLNNVQISEKADIVWCDAFLVRDEIIGKLSESYVFQSNQEKYYVLNNSGPWRKLIKKSIIESHNLFFPKLRSYEDIAVVPQYGLYAQKIVCLDEPLYYYVLHEGSVMHQKVYSEKLLAIFDSMDALYTGFEKVSKLDTFHEEIEYLFIDHLLHAASLRFFTFSEGMEQIDKVLKIMKTKFPNWKRNMYYKKSNWKYKLVCRLFYNKQFALLKLMIK